MRVPLCIEFSPVQPQPAIYFDRLQATEMDAALVPPSRLKGWEECAESRCVHYHKDLNCQRAYVSHLAETQHKPYKNTSWYKKSLQYTYLSKASACEVILFPVRSRDYRVAQIKLRRHSQHCDAVAFLTIWNAFHSLGSFDWKKMSSPELHKLMEM